MKNTALLATIFLILAGTGCFDFHHGGVKGSGIEATETRQVGPFTGIDLTGSPDVTLKIGSPQSVKVTADDNIVGLIKTVVRGSTLVIKSERNYSSRTGVRVDITVERIDDLQITGSGDMTASGLETDSLTVQVTGSGDLACSGTAGEVEATVTGSGSIDLKNLEAQTGSATLTGSGDIDIKVLQSFDGSVMGSGDIRYFGNPQDVSTNVTGSGDIIAR
jgi:hypothetical protein